MTAKDYSVCYYSFQTATEKGGLLSSRFSGGIDITEPKATIKFASISVCVCVRHLRILDFRLRFKEFC